MRYASVSNTHLRGMDLDMGLIKFNILGYKLYPSPFQVIQIDHDHGDDDDGDDDDQSHWDCQTL